MLFPLTANKAEAPEIPRMGHLLSLSHGLFAIVWEEQVTPNGATYTHWCGAGAGTLIVRHQTCCFQCPATV